MKDVMAITTALADRNRTRVLMFLRDGGRMDSPEASRRMGLALSLANDPAADLDESRARKVLPVVARLLGIEWSEPK